jgi:Ca2+-binding EF-hand superfamily protein
MKFNDPPYNAGLTDEEVLAIVRDFDEDGSGSISLEEFKAVVESAEK